MRALRGLVRPLRVGLGLAWLGLAPSLRAAPIDNPLNVYFIGNSVTDTLKYDGLKQLATNRNYGQVWGRQMIPGAPLSWLWQHPGDGFQEAPYGYPTNALPNYTWDAVTLQPFDRLLAGAEGDLAMGSNFIALALSRPANSNTQFYVYSRWPRRDDAGSPSFDYAAKWLRSYTGGWDNSNESRDYFQQVTVGLRAVFTNRAPLILMVPVGDVLYEVDQRMRAGQVAGYSNIVQVYSDGIHFNNEGSYIVGLTFFATLYREDPAGLPSAPYGVTNAAFATAVQDAVWDVVNGHPYSGVNVVPEPRAATLTLLAAALAWARVHDRAGRGGACDPGR